MTFLRKLYCRTFQGVMRIILPFLPYRQPEILTDDDEVVAELKDEKINKVLLVTDKSIRNLGLTKSIEREFKENNIDFYIFDETVPNPTTQNVLDALKIYKENDCHAIIAIGGGSVIDCAKAVGAKVAQPKKTLKQMKGILKVGKKTPVLIAVPTTAGTGSETTLAAVIVDSETRHKYAINDFPLIPEYALLKPELTLNLPKNITSTTGMDALCHAVEAYIGRSTTNQTRRKALSAVKEIFENLPIAYEDGQDYDAREKMLMAAYDAGVAFTKSYVGNVHAMAHALGGKYNVSHGLANAVILPYVLRAYGKKVYKKLWKMGVYAGLFKNEVSKEEGARIFIEKIEQMNNFMSIPNRIKELKEEDILELSITAENEANPLYPVPVIFGREQFAAIYKKLI